MERLRPREARRLLMLVFSLPTSSPEEAALSKTFIYNFDKLKEMYPNAPMGRGKGYVFLDHPHIYYNIKAMMEKLEIPSVLDEPDGKTNYAVFREIKPDKRLQDYLEQVSKTWFETHPIIAEYTELTKKVEKGVPLVEFEDTCRQIVAMRNKVKDMQQYDFGLHLGEKNPYEDFLKDLRTLLDRLYKELEKVNKTGKSAVLKMHPDLSFDAQVKLAKIDKKVVRDAFFAVKDIIESGDECNHLSLARQMKASKSAAVKYLQDLVKSGLVVVTTVPQVIGRPRAVYEIAPKVLKS